MIFLRLQEKWRRPLLRMVSKEHISDITNNTDIKVIQGGAYMPRPKKDAHPVSIKMTTEIYDRLEDYCNRSGQTKTMAIERAITRYIDEYDALMKPIEKKLSSHS